MGQMWRGGHVCALAVLCAGMLMAATAKADVYWANAGTNTIGRANLDGTSPSPRYLGVHSLNVAIGGGYLYYINSDSIGRVALDGSSSDPNLITGLDNPNGVAVTGSAIYWLSVAGGSATILYKANLDGSNVTPIVTGIDGGYDVVATSGNVYWSTGCISGTNPCNGWIGRSDLNGGSLSQDWTAGRAPFGLAVDSTYIYSATSTGAINRTNLSTQGTDTLVSGLPTAVGVAVDGSHLYWSEGINGATIGRANLDGSSPNPNFITGISEPYGLAVDPAHTGPLVVQPPTLGGGTAEGQTLQESHGAWSGSPGSYTYQWQRCNASGASCAAISGATQAAYTLGAADLGATLRVQEVATNPYGASLPATSSPSGVVQSSAPSNTAPPTITGGTLTGDVLTEVPGAWTNIPTSYAYQWWRCNAAGAACATVPGATAQGYALRSGDVGSTIRVQEFATNVWGTGTSGLSPATAVIQAPQGPAPDGTSLTLSASPDLALRGKPVTLLAHVVDDVTPGLVPKGTVTFLAGKSTLGTVPVSSHGFASLTTKTLRGPEQSLTAVFTPAAGWAGSVSNVYDELIVPPSSIPAPKGCTRMGATLPVHVTRAIAVKTVTYLIDGKRVAVSTRSPFSVRVATKKLTHGKHRLTARLTYHTSHGIVTRTLKGTFRIC